MIKSVYFYSYHANKLFCLPEKQAIKEQSKKKGRIVPKSEALSIIEREKIRAQEERQAKLDAQNDSEFAIPFEEADDPEVPEEEVEVAPLSEEEEMQEMLNLLIANGTVELKGSWYKYQGKNYRKAEILEII